MGVACYTLRDGVRALGHPCPWWRLFLGISFNKVIRNFSTIRWGYCGAKMSVHHYPDCIRVSLDLLRQPKEYQQVLWMLPCDPSISACSEKGLHRQLCGLYLLRILQEWHKAKAWTHKYPGFKVSPWCWCWQLQSRATSRSTSVICTVQKCKPFIILHEQQLWPLLVWDSTNE